MENLQAALRAARQTQATSWSTADLLCKGYCSVLLGSTSLLQQVFVTLARRRLYQAHDGRQAQRTEHCQRHLPLAVYYLRMLITRDC